ncbi:uncharacterized protein A4U43_C08F8440 [Asparagus officinalis]|nr:uncharacterized protein A4U43_C08F8440 [Asparagus officinalis]
MEGGCGRPMGGWPTGGGWPAGATGADGAAAGGANGQQMTNRRVTAGDRWSEPGGGGWRPEISTYHPSFPLAVSRCDLQAGVDADVAPGAAKEEDFQEV